MATTNSGQTATETFGTTSPVSGSAPTAIDGSDGQPVADFSAITVVAECPASQTLSGAGTLECYVFDPDVGGWARRKEADLSVNVATTTTRRQTWTVELDAPRNAYVKWVPAAVTFSGGSTGVKVFQLGFAERSRGKYRPA